MGTKKWSAAQIFAPYNKIKICTLNKNHFFFNSIKIYVRACFRKSGDGHCLLATICLMNLYTFKCPLRFKCIDLKNVNDPSVLFLFYIHFKHESHNFSLDPFDSHFSNIKYYNLENINRRFIRSLLNYIQTN